jgi:hypothetical protein
MVAPRHNKPLREDYNRITSRNPRHKKIGLTALQRKLLLLIYTLWKTGEIYEEANRWMSGEEEIEFFLLLDDSPKKQVIP